MEGTSPAFILICCRYVSNCDVVLLQIQVVDVRFEGPIRSVLGPAFVTFGTDADGLPEFGDKCGVVPSVPLLCNGKWRLLCRDLEIPVPDFLNYTGMTVESTRRSEALFTASNSVRPSEAQWKAT